MSRDYGRDESLDPRDVAANALRDPRGEDRLEPSREPVPVETRSVEPRKTYEVRGRTYRLRASEIQTLAELGKFRAVASKDLEEFAYHADKDRMRPDVQNLIRQRLVAERVIPHRETAPRRLLTLTKQGHRFLTSTKRVHKNQSIHYGFTKPREAHHDADLYRLYYKAAEKIERQGGRNLRVILDYELKKRLYREIAKLGPDRHSIAKKREVAERHGLKLVRGKIPLPDLRIEYETRDGELGRVDLELATEHYRGRNLVEKAQAGFSIYAHAQDAPGLRRVLDQRELTAEILSL